MNLKNRVRRLEEKANMMAIGRGRSVSSRLCTGISSEELLQMIEERLLPESVPVLENIVQQMEEYHQRPPRKLPNGEMTQDIHGFMDWLWGLEAAALPCPRKSHRNCFWRGEMAMLTTLPAVRLFPFVVAKTACSCSLMPPRMASGRPSIPVPCAAAKTSPIRS